MADPTRVALVLGSGGARGYAHIGVIDVLRQRGYEIVSVAGTSMGAVVGGMYAAGRLAAYTEWVRSLGQRDVWRLLDPSLSAAGAIRADKIFAKLAELLAGVAIEELAVPFTAVATDLLAGREVWFQRGPLDAAMRASFALPSVVAPVAREGRLLVDGGLLNPVPVAATAASPAEVTVAVSLSELQPPVGEPLQRAVEPRPAGEALERLRAGVARVLDGDVAQALSGWFAGGRETGAPVEATGQPAADHRFEALPAGLGALDVMQLSLAATQRLVTRYQLAAYPPDVLITVPKAACHTLDFHRADELIDLGRELAETALDERDERH